MARLSQSLSNTIITNPLAVGTEAVIVQTGNFGLIYDNAQTIIVWSLTIVFGAGATAFAIRLRRGNGTTGTQIGGFGNIAVTASTTAYFCGMDFDSPGVAAGASYSVCGLVTGGAATHSLGGASVVAFCL